VARALPQWRLVYNNTSIKCIVLLLLYVMRYDLFHGPTVHFGRSNAPTKCTHALRNVTETVRIVNILHHGRAQFSVIAKTNKFHKRQLAVKFGICVRNLFSVSIDCDIQPLLFFFQMF
jgi:hypothetical protein